MGCPFECKVEHVGGRFTLYFASNFEHNHAEEDGGSRGLSKLMKHKITQMVAGIGLTVKPAAVVDWVRASLEEEIDGHMEKQIKGLVGRMKRGLKTSTNTNTLSALCAYEQVELHIMHHMNDEL